MRQPVRRMTRPHTILICSVIALVVALVAAAVLGVRLYLREWLTEELVEAVHENKHYRIGELVRFGADPNVQQPTDAKDGDTAATLAAYDGDVDLLDLLLSHGLKIDDGTNGYNALMAASGTGQEACVRFLLKRGANPRATDTDGLTALMNAADSRSGAEVIPTLVRAGANVEARDKHGSTALMWAAMRRNPSEVAALLEAGANPDAKDSEGKTALDLARYAGDNPWLPSNKEYRRRKLRTIRILTSWRLRKRPG